LAKARRDWIGFFPRDAEICGERAILAGQAVPGRCACPICRVDHSSRSWPRSRVRSGGHELSIDPNPLRFGRNFLDTFRDVYRLEFPAINTAVGISGPAFPMNAADRLWVKYKLGERSKIIDPMTKQPAVRNIFLDGGDTSIKAMQARGLVFWQCNVALGQVARQLATATNAPFDEVRADLVAGLNPGVRLVPSHVMALALAQERGFTYMKP
jgi:hypothetical protein